MRELGGANGFAILRLPDSKLSGEILRPFRTETELSAGQVPDFYSDLGSPILTLLGGTVVKRLVDVVFSLALLVIASPVLALAALMILATSPGPVLFRQVRMGRGFQPFEILKLRTMAHARAHTKSGPLYTLGPDPRITPLGKWLRLTKIDELPQLWNVLWGEMSLVGPRPVLPELTEEFHEFYAFLLRVRPGLTDPASLKYSQETRLLGRAADPLRFFKNVVTPDKIRMSFEYMGRANLWTDFATMAMTAVICCFPSMSRFYGELPVIAEGRRSGELQPMFLNQTAPSPVNESIFAHDLAYLEAATEEVAEWRTSPWILGREPDLGLRSASQNAKSGVSRL